MIYEIYNPHTPYAIACACIVIYISFHMIKDLIIGEPFEPDEKED